MQTQCNFLYPTKENMTYAMEIIATLWSKFKQPFIVGLGQQLMVLYKICLQIKSKSDRIQLA